MRVHRVRELFFCFLFSFLSDLYVGFFYVPLDSRRDDEKRKKLFRYVDVSFNTQLNFDEKNANNRSNE